jgi:hypothetical protein
MKNHIIEVKGCIWSGPTKRMAERARDASLELLLQGPTIITRGSLTLVVYPRADSWSYQISSSSAFYGGFVTKEQAIRAGRCDAAQRVYDSEGLASIEWIEHPEDRKGHLSWMKFQQAYAKLAVEHPDWSSHELHRAACEAACEAA